MGSIQMVAALLVAAVLLIFIVKFMFGKKKKLPKPSEVQKKVAYDERYPKRGKILQKEYNLEEEKPDEERD